MKHYTKFQEVALLALRLVIGAIFISAGYAKFGLWSSAPAGMSATMLNLMKLMSIVEPLGGVALVAGFLTFWASTGLAIIMVGAIFVMQFTMNVGFAAPQGPGWDFPLVILVGCLALMAFGAGRWAVDAKLKKA